MGDELDRISYSEGVKVQIGDYESRDVHISYSTNVKNKEKVSDALKRAKKTVQMSLRKAEKKIRLSSEDDVDFETLERLNYYSEQG
jgi:hypothetical protein